LEEELLCLGLLPGGLRHRMLSDGVRQRALRQGGQRGGGLVALARGEEEGLDAWDVLYRCSWRWS